MLGLVPSPFLLATAIEEHLYCLAEVVEIKWSLHVDDIIIGDLLLIEQDT